MLFVDAGNNTVGIGDGAPTEAGLVIASIGTDANTSARLALKSTETSVDTFLRFGRFGTGDDASFTIANNYYRTSSGYVADDTSYGPTSIYFGDGEMSFGTVLGAAAPLQRMIIKGSEIVINEQSYNQDFRVESNSQANFLLLDASAEMLLVGGGSNTAGGASFKVSQGNDGELTLDSTSAESNIVSYDRNGGGYHPLNIYGSNVNINPIAGGSAIFNEASLDADFRVESDNNANMFVIDAANDCVNIGTSSSIASQDATLNVNGFGIKSFSVNSNTLTDTGISVNQEGSGMACMVLASNHYSTGAATRAAQYFLQFYYNGNTAPAVVQVAGTTGLVTFGVSANNTLTIQMPAGGNHISFLMSG
jgi:hypothetical protein